MASIRIGIKSEFNLVDSKVGVGTTNPTEAMDVRGQIYSDNSIGAGGISTVTTYQGFLDTKQTIKSSVSEGTVVAGSLSGEIVIEGEVTVSSGTTYTSGPENLTVTDNFTLPGISDDKPSVGTMRFNENLAALEFYTGVEWKTVNSRIDGGNAGRGFWIGGYSPYNLVIDYVNIQTQGNATSFGDLLSTTVGSGSDGPMCCGNEIRGLAGGGNGPGGMAAYIQYITTSSKGNAINFGNLFQTRFRGSGLASSTRGIFGGGRTPSTVNTIDYVEIMTLGTALDFGDLVAATKSPGSVSSSTRGLFAGGQGGVGKISAVTIASTGNSPDFGKDMFIGGYTHGGGSTGVRGMWAGGYSIPSASPYPVSKHTRSIRGVIIASDGNAVEFGELKRTLGLTYLGGLSDKTRACWGGGYVLAPATQVNTIEYFQMNSSGNAMDFGDLTQTRSILGSLSDCHGGLGGF